METKELIERVCVVEKGISEYTKHRTAEILGFPTTNETESTENPPKLEFYHPAKDPRELRTNENIPESPKKYSSVKEKIETIGKINKTIPKIELTDKDKKLLRKLEIEHEKRQSTSDNAAKATADMKLNDSNDKNNGKDDEIKPKIKPVIKPRVTVSIFKILSHFF